MVDGRSFVTRSSLLASMTTEARYLAETDGDDELTEFGRASVEDRLQQIGYLE